MLFGAGASYGSGYIDPYPPPLGINLFTELKKNYPQTWGKISEYEQYFTENFENGMRIVYESSKKIVNINVLICNIAEYFCNFRINDNSNLYVKLINAMGSRTNIIYSSLNYDLLFESALEKENVNYDYFNERKGAVSFLKIHGSSNFLPPGNNIFINCDFQVKNSISFPSIEVGDCTRVREFCRSTNSISPIMAIYMHDKPLLITSQNIPEIQERWRQYVSKADKILIIGVKPNPDDKHIWDSLSNSKGRIGIVGSSKHFDDWRNLHRTNDIDILLGNYWEECIDDCIKFIK
ncbi:MAG: hypothetical protein L0H53_00235 [Candidatus Nitrosocosmicus sp.]|nr:hypothetical protein [Candidatus Nitrosocosmicus sp.]MDN5866361.1 hypothetical protein [Candidatus Nitrosocosmicus sp.]